MDPVTIAIIGIVVSATVGGIQIYQNRNTSKSIKQPSLGSKHNIPHRNYFVGRTEEILKIQQALNSRSFIISITGIGGIGKTSLAIEVAYKVLKQNKFDKIIWISDKENNVILNTISKTIIGIFGRNELLKLTSDQMVLKTYEILSNNKCLIVIDNFESIQDIEVVKFVNNIPEPSKILITSRENIIEESKVFQIQGLDQKSARKLIESKSKEVEILKQLKSANIKDIDNLVEVCGGHPLGIKWSLGQIANGLQNFTEIANFIYEGGHDIFVRLFDNSWPTLNKDEQDVLTIVSLCKSKLNIEIIKSALSLNTLDLNKCILKLSKFSLLDKDGADGLIGFSCHEITKNFVGSKISQSNKRNLLQSLNSSYTSNIDKLLQNKFDDYGFINDQLDNIIYLIYASLEFNWDSSKCLLLKIKWYLWEKGMWELRNQVYIDIINHSKAILNENNIMLFSSDIAWVFFRQKKIELALDWLTKAESVDFQRVDNNAKVAFFSVKGMILKSEGNYNGAKENLLKALGYCDSNSSTFLEMMRIMTYLGEMNRSKGHLEEAKQWFVDTLDLAKAKNYRAGESWTYQNLATLEIIEKNEKEAISLLNKSLIIAEDINRLHTVAECKFLLGNLMKKSESTTSKRLLREAEQVYKSLGLPNSYDFNDR